MRDEFSDVVKPVAGMLMAIMLLSIIVVSFPTSPNKLTYAISGTTVTPITTTTQATTTPTSPIWHVTNAYLEGEGLNAYFHDLSYGVIPGFPGEGVYVWITHNIQTGGLVCWVIWVFDKNGVKVDEIKAKTASGYQEWGVWIYAKDIAERYGGAGKYTVRINFYSDEEYTVLAGYTNNLVFTIAYY